MVCGAIVSKQIFVSEIIEYHARWKCTQNFESETLRRKNNAGKIRANFKIILTCLFKEKYKMAWTGLI